MKPTGYRDLISISNILFISRIMNNITRSLRISSIKTATGKSNFKRHFSGSYKPNPRLIGAVLDGLSKLKLKKLVPIVTPEEIAAYEAGKKTGDKDLNITELLTKYGYEVETHHVKTEDGYTLKMFRIPSDGSVVYLEHGFWSSSDDWVTLGPKKSLAYLLANEGYDVWIGNARGNKHCLEHETLTPKQEAFWDFSFDEIGRYDLPAVIDYILNVTKKEQLIYIGHSQGTTVFFVLCSERPEYNSKVSYMVALSAVAFMGHTASPLFKMIAPFAQGHDSIFRACVGPAMLQNGAVPAILKPFLNSGNLVQNVIRHNMGFMFVGFDNCQLDYEALATIASHTPAGASTKQFEHYCQNIVSGGFKRFDYREKNNAKYGSNIPPDYPLEKITVPMAIYQAKSDWVVTENDFTRLLSCLKNSLTVHIIPYENFGHIDFLFAKNAHELLYHDIMQLLKKVDQVDS